MTGDDEQTADTELSPLAQVRLRAGLSQFELAELLGISPATLSAWERGNSAPSGDARDILILAKHSPRVLTDLWAAHKFRG